MFLIKKLSKTIVWLCVHIVAFILLVWLLLGLTPTQTVQVSHHNIINMINGTKGFGKSVARTAERMSDVAQHHLNEAAERIDGKDPYENYNATLDARVHKDF